MTLRQTTSAIVFGALVASGSAVPALAGGPTAVIELFTSQGCSSCPPADKLFTQYSGRDDILALSFSVDYWDYLGWKDTLASPENTERQRSYASARGDGQVYTPQAVIDGVEHVTGSNKGAIEAALVRNAGALSVPITLSSTSDAVSVTIAGSDAPVKPHATLWLVMFDREVTVPIERGENTGATITYTNVVKKLRPIAMWKGELMTVDLPKSEMEHAKAGGCAVLLQSERDGLPGPILGAATMKAAW